MNFDDSHQIVTNPTEPTLVSDDEFVAKVDSSGLIKAHCVGKTEDTGVRRRGFRIGLRRGETEVAFIRGAVGELARDEGGDIETIRHAGRQPVEYDPVP